MKLNILLNRQHQLSFFFTPFHYGIIELELPELAKTGAELEMVASY